MYYAIERVQPELAFDNSFISINIGQLVFDIVKGPKNTGLDLVSTFILGDQNVLVKSDPRIESEFKKKFTQATGIEIQELLLG